MTFRPTMTRQSEDETDFNIISFIRQSFDQTMLTIEFNLYANKKFIVNFT